MNRSSRSTLFLGPLLSSFALVACGGDPPPPAATPTVTAAPQPAPLAKAAPVATEPAPPPAPAADDKFAKVEIKAQKVSGNVYMLEGAGGNIGVLVGDDGIVIVDDQFAPLAPKIRAALKNISDKPVKFVVNTHWHGDHTGGNAAFSTDASIVAQENVRKRLVEGRPAFELAGKMRDAVPPAPKEALPVVTFQDTVSIHVNGEDIRAIHYPNGHTDGDSVIYFTKANVVHMGDDFTTGGYPVVDVGSGGSVRGLMNAIDKVTAELPADVKVIPGHGPLSTIDDIKKLSARLKEVVKTVDAEVKKKKTLEQLKAANVLGKFDDMGKGMISNDVFLDILYKELTEPKAPAKKPGASPSVASAPGTAPAAAPAKKADPAAASPTPKH